MRAQVQSSVNSKQLSVICPRCGKVVDALTICRVRLTKWYLKKICKLCALKIKVVARMTAQG